MVLLRSRTGVDKTRILSIQWSIFTYTRIQLKSLLRNINIKVKFTKKLTISNSYSSAWTPSCLSQSQMKYEKRKEVENVCWHLSADKGCQSWRAPDECCQVSSQHPPPRKCCASFCVIFTFFTSSFASFTMGRFTKPLTVLTTALRASPSIDRCRSTTIPFFHVFLLLFSSAIITTSCKAMGSRGGWNHLVRRVRDGKYSRTQRFQNWFASWFDW